MDLKRYQRRVVDEVERYLAHVAKERAAGNTRHPALDAWRDLRQFSTGGTYLNFLTEEEGRDRIEAAYGRATLAKLAALKRKHDPDNLFRHTKQVLV